MRISTYEIILPLFDGDDREIEDKALLINGLYGAMDVVDAYAAEALRAGDWAKLPFELREKLMMRGHITRKDEAGELADAKLLGRVWRKMIGHSGVGLVIAPTFDCNFRCPYCFESHRLKNGKEWLSRTMSPEMVDALFAALQKERDKGRKIAGCSLYGGEPLLRENIETVRNICKHAKEMGLSISAITNGYDLDVYIDLLKEYEIQNMQITVDGVGEMNDRRRRHRDGVPTYERILQNTALALDNGIDVSLRVNTNGENIGNIGALMEDLAAHGLKEAGDEERESARREAEEAKKAGKPKPKRKGFFSYYFKAVSEAQDSPTRVTDQQVFDAIRDAGCSAGEAIKKQSQYSMLEQRLTAAMKKQDYPDYSPAFCGSEKSMVCVGPDALLFTCWDLVAMPDESVGFLDVASGRFLYDFSKAKWSTRTSDLMEPCRTCPYIFICRGGCAAQAHAEHGSYFREYCGETKEIFAFVAGWTVEKKWLETKEDELSISLMGPLSRLTEAERETLMTGKDRKEILEIINEVGIWNKKEG